ncbi:MAG TPA: ABC transporter substrate-binding protein [Deinococcales bacterium]|nr:ABC transporter substrate-binding protein [Deinococcales bacterium]
MKRLAAFVLAALIIAPTVAARDYNEIRKSGVIRIGTEGAFPPFNYFQGKTLTGFEIDLAKAIAAKLNLKVEWVTLPFDSLLPALNTDRFDFAIASHSPTPARAKAVDFTNPHYCTGGMIVARQGGPKTAADLAGKSVAVQVGTTYLENVQKVSGVGQVRTFPKDTDALQNLVGGRVDAWVSDRFVAIEAAQKNKTANLQLGDLLFSETIAMAVKKNNSALKGALNSALAGLLNDGTYAKISNRWFQQDIRCK